MSSQNKLLATVIQPEILLTWLFYDQLRDFYKLLLRLVPDIGWPFNSSPFPHPVILLFTLLSLFNCYCFTVFAT